MSKQLKPGMAVPKPTRSGARKRYYQRRVRRAWFLILAALILTSAICVLVVNPVLAPNTTTSSITEQQTEPFLSPTASSLSTQGLETDLPNNPTISFPTIQAVLPTQAQPVTYPKDTPVLYYAQSGDSLAVLAIHFGVELNEITSSDELPQEGLIPPGQLLFIPSRLDSISSPLKLIPDSEVVNSPSTLDFDVTAFVEEAGGYLSTYKEYLSSTGFQSGAEIVAKVALDYSVNPRLLLALLEYQSAWVYGSPSNIAEQDYAMGYVGYERKGFFNQCAWAAGEISDGYYGWREGTIVALTFPDKTMLRFAPDLNSGTAGLIYLFSRLNNLPDWAEALYGENSIIDQYEQMFGSPWVRAQAYEPLFTVDVEQPEMILPFEFNKTWAFTGGPHAAWGVADVRAALDFAPPSDGPGCLKSPEWVLASVSGLVVRSAYGAVVIDVDGDGYEQTGWNLLYMHIATTDRIPLGTWVEVGDRIGHPSCEGGRSTGTHVHLARKYNGEWVPADGPLAFVLDGWKAKAGPTDYSGWLIKDDKIIRASLASTFESQLRREQE